MPRPYNQFRVAALAATGLLDDAGSNRLDRLTERVSRLLAVPVALASLITDEEQVFVSAVGLPEPLASARRMPLNYSLCRHVVGSAAPLVIEDARTDQRWSANPGVTELGMIAYAGFPMQAPDGQVLGSFCAIDVHPRAWSEQDLAILESLSDAAASEIALLLTIQALRSSTAALHRVFDNINDLVRTVEVMPNGRFRAVFSSTNTQDILGGDLHGDPDVDVNDTLFSMVYSEDRTAYEAFRRQVRTGHPAEVEYRMNGMDGITRWVWTRATIRQENGRLFVDAVTRNVTERKRVESALEEERRRLRQAQTIAGIGSWEWDPDTNLMTWSDTLYQLYGVDQSKFSAAQANDHVIHPDDLSAMTEEFRRCARTGEALLHRYRVVRPADGRTRIFEARAEALYGSGMDVLRLAGTAADITDQVAAQKEVARRETLLQAILSNSRSLIYVKDTGGQFRVATESLLRSTFS